MGRHRASGGRLMLYTSVAVQLLALLRNVVIARILGPHEFGLAATIILTVAFMDSLSNAGTQNILVQAKEDDDGRLLASTHAVSVGRGLATVVLMVVVAIPLVNVLQLDLSLPALALVAVASLIAGFSHRGIKSVQRTGDFRAESLTQLASEAGNLAIAIPVAFLTHSYIAIVAGLVARSVVSVAASHLLVKLPYRLKWSRDEMQRLWSFSWPLLINGPLLFISAQADRLIVTTTLGPASLGVYSAIAVLVMSPSAAILKWLGTTHFPTLSRYFHAQGNLADAGPVFRYSAAMISLGWLMIAGFICFGSAIVGFLYGPKYHTPPLIIGLIGLLQIIRFLRAWPSTLSLSAAANGGILVSTVVRLATLPLALLGAELAGGLSGLIAGFALGEFLALVVSLILANRNANRPTFAGVFTTVSFITAVIALLWIQSKIQGQLVYDVPLFLVAAALGVSALVLSISTSGAQELREEIALKWRPGSKRP